MCLANSAVKLYAIDVKVIVFYVHCVYLTLYSVKLCMRVYKFSCFRRLQD